MTIEDAILVCGGVLSVWASVFVFRTLGRSF
jgi:hypothetical protein